MRLKEDRLELGFGGRADLYIRTAYSEAERFIIQDNYNSIWSTDFQDSVIFSQVRLMGVCLLCFKFISYLTLSPRGQARPLQSPYPATQHEPSPRLPVLPSSAERAFLPSHLPRMQQKRILPSHP